MVRTCVSIRVRALESKNVSPSFLEKATSKKPDQRVYNIQIQTLERTRPLELPHTPLSPVNGTHERGQLNN